MKRAIVAITSDLHTNSTVGLCPPYVALDDGGHYRSSKVQRWLYKGWLGYVEKAQELSQQHDAPIITIFNGDIHDGDHHDTSQIVSRNESTQAKIAWSVIEPLVEASEKVIVIRGTESHVGGAAAREEALATDINALGPCDDINSWWHLKAEIAGVKFDIAHHWTRGGLPWTGANTANKLAATVTMEYAINNQPAPDLVFRSHMHQWADSYDNFPNTRAICLPAWQLKTAYVHKRPSSKLPDIGGAFVMIENGRYEVIKYRHTPKPAPFTKVVI